jgi:hypothetical protein
MQHRVVGRDFLHSSQSTNTLIPTVGRILQLSTLSLRWTQAAISQMKGDRLGGKLFPFFDLLSPSVKDTFYMECYD